MEKTTIANEKTNRFFVRLRRIPGEHWYLAAEGPKITAASRKVKVPDEIRTQDFLIDQISFFNKQIWYHFTYGDLSGWLPKRNIRKTFRRLDVPAIKQATQADIDNQLAALAMLLKTAGCQISEQQLRTAIEEWQSTNTGLIGLSDLIISETHSIRDLNEVNLRQLDKQILRRRPIILKVGGLDNLKSSLIVLTGFNRKLYFYNDPWTGRLESISENHLKKHWLHGNLEAISY
ncbi:papain-like cysteine protease family protein [Lentilactobacillus raoultii]|uniref:Papain-like cysteine protease family protein n=1 Tax=Lentilactobacillus raoultii TaxID=1987503 RepID=A0ABW3PQF7_9LACO|nr:papain-like cysteine protease family protein [Lentilactobacillus raoultii]